MTLIVLEDAIKEAHAHVDQKNFSEIIRDCRTALGLKQYRAAEFAGIAETRLKNLETGYFRSMPAGYELHAFARLYDLNPNILEKKAKEHCRAHTQKLGRRSAFEPTSA